jgi:hypothetical protein
MSTERYFIQTQKSELLGKLSLSIFMCLLSLSPFTLYSQCIPVNCLDSLPPYGGICDKSVPDGKVGQFYNGFTSFHITTTCLDAGILDTLYKNVGAKMLKLHSFTFKGLPTGLSVVTNQTEYNSPANGCAGITGTPVEAGVFKIALHALVNIRTWPISATCSGLLSLDVNNQAFDGAFSLRILPDAGFKGLDPTCCVLDPPFTLTPTGNTGGTFSGPGVSGNAFNPSLAGVGVHSIKYEITEKQGVAIEPATASSVFTVTVSLGNTYYADNDNDGFGNPDVKITGCYKPAGFVTNNQDCADSNGNIHPGAIDIPDNGIDEDCNGYDTKLSDSKALEENKFKIYPNPAHDYLIIENPADHCNAQIRIYSVLGQLWIGQKLEDLKNLLNISNLPKGVFVIILKDDNHISVSEIVKK